MSGRNKNLSVLVLSLALIVSALIYSPMAQAATTYYISSSDPNRSDTNPGISSSAPWATLAKVSSRTFTAGDQILFKKGDTWSGEQLRLHSDETASSSYWITVSSYGTASAKPKFTNPPADYDQDLLYPYYQPGEYCYPVIVIKNDPGWKIKGLDISTNAEHGIIVWANSGTRDGYWIEDCDIHDLSKMTQTPTAVTSYGIWFNGCYISSIFRNVTVLNCTMKYITYSGTTQGGALWLDCIENFTVDGFDVFNTHPSGIAINGCTNGTIKNSRLNQTGEPSGAGMYLGMSSNVVIQDTEVGNILTSPTYWYDGVGIDWEGGCENITVQRCYFHDIDDESIMLYSAGGGCHYNSGTTLIDNLIVNCGRNIGTHVENMYNPPNISNLHNLGGVVSGNIVYKTYADQITNIVRDNVLPNPSLEDTPAQWTLVGGATIGTGRLFLGGHALLGNKYLQLPPNSSASVVIPSSLVVHDGLDHTHGVKASSEYTAAGSTGVITLVMRDAGNAQISSYVTTPFPYVPDPGWPISECFEYFNVPANTDHIDVTISNTGGTATLYVDVASVYNGDASVMTDNWPNTCAGFSYPTPYNVVYHEPGSDFKAKNDYDRNTTHLQGYRRWWYQYMSGGTYSDMTWNATYNAFVGVDALMTGNWCHPGNYDAVRSWEAPYTGTVRATGVVSLESTSGTDGVKATIKQNTTTKWGPKTLTLASPSADHTPLTELGEIRVAKGDYVRFEINQNVNNNYDGTLWNPRVNYTEVSPNEYTSTSLAGGQMWNWVTTSNLQGWTNGNKTTLSWGTGGYLNASVTGASPYIKSPVLSSSGVVDNRIDTSIFRRVKIGMKNSNPRTSARLRWITDVDTTWNTAKSVTFALVPNDTVYREYFIDLGGKALWRDNVTQLRLYIGAASNDTYSIDYVKALPGNHWGFNVAGDLEGWNTFNHLGGTPTVSDGCLGGLTGASVTGNDPAMHSGSLWFNAKDYKYAKIKMKTSSVQGTDLTLFWITNLSPQYMDYSRSKSVAISQNADYTTYVVPLHENPEWKDIITQLRLDPVEGGPGGSVSIDSITLTNSLYDDRYFYL